MKICQAACLLLATPAVAFVPHNPDWKTSRKKSSRPSSARPLQLSPGDLPAPLDGITGQINEKFETVLSSVLSQLQTTSSSLENIVGGLDGINGQVNEKYAAALNSVLSQLRNTLSQESALQAEFMKYATRISQAIDQWLLQQNPQAEALYQQVQSQLSVLTLDTPEALAITAVVTYIVISNILSWGRPPPSSKPYPLQRYDPIAAQAFFDSKPAEALARGLEIAAKSLGFGLGVLKDKVDNKWEENQENRGMELAQLLTDLGPTFIKIGQSLSIRTDILSPGYVKGLASLQDKVPSFDTRTAKLILEEEWGQSVDSVLSKISDEPVAAASLGQVYKATMKDGREVAIKVQRPNIMNQIALDMHLLREFAPIAKNTFNLNTDTVGTVDAWGGGFVDELDYIAEAQNGMYFMKRIQETPLKDVVLAPGVVEEFTTAKVLVTEWIDGERLDKSSSEDVTVLCSICMNTYLTMLLELGLLHCDPHPGNLLRTPEGKLCILDWGMVTRLPPELQLTLIEHMAHLTSSDYAEVPRDLLLLGFIPEDKADAIEGSGVVEVLADIYGAWTSGGGVAAINVNEVVSQLQDLTAKNGNLFQIPPYFAYIAKSFSVLEGIGLSNDPQYSIINECLPYVSNRLLTDQTTMGPALSTFIFGPEKGNIDTRIVDYKRVEQLVTGFGNFTTSASGALLGKEDLSRTQLLEEAADQVLDIVVTDEETPFQDILLEQLAKIVASNTRSIWTQVRESSGTLPSGRTLLGTLVDPLGLFRSSALVNPNDADEKTVETTGKLIKLVRNQLSSSNGSMLDLSDLEREELVELSSILARKVWERRIGLLKTGNRFATKLLQVTAVRLETGERVDRPMRPSSIDELPVKDDALVESSSFTIPQPGGSNAATAAAATTATTTATATSSRLSAARSRLEQLELDEEELNIPVNRR